MGGSSAYAAGSGTNKLPKLNFPTFNGENLKLWMRRAEDYFDLYAVEPDVWVKLATWHFSTAAARWLQSVEKRIRVCGWLEFCK